MLSGKSWLSLGVMALFLLLGLACRAPAQRGLGGELNLYNWEDYFGPETISQFEQEFGVKVNLETYDSENTMLSAVQSSPHKYDVVIASESLVQTMIALRLLAPLDLGATPNLSHLEDRFRNLAFDPENKYSVPYLWGTTGIAINTRFLPEGADSWGALWDPRYAGRIAMLNDPREAIAAALKALGYSLNTDDPAQLEAAGVKLKAQRPLLRGYLDTIAIIKGLASGELWLAQLYNGDALSAAQENPDIRYIIPREGAALWIDNLVVPVAARHREAAHAFINFIHRPGVSAAIADYLNYATPNRGAQGLLDPQVRDNPAIFPPPEVVARAELYQPLGPQANAITNRVWAELQRGG